MKTEAEIRQIKSDLIMVVRMAVDPFGAACAAASLGAIQWVLGESDDGGPADILDELRANVKKWKASSN